MIPQDERMGVIERSRTATDDLTRVTKDFLKASKQVDEMARLRLGVPD